MFLKNFTSNVPVSQTVYRIEQVLIKAGVSGIMKEYGAAGEVSAITFQIKLEGNAPYSVRLPADKVAATESLWRDYADGDKLSPDGQRLAYNTRKQKTRADFIEQGERTAWKLVQDWIEVQISMIQMKQADFMQVFLPYVWDGHETVYQRLKAGNYRALLPESTT